MTEAEAKNRCEDLSATSPERGTHSWLPRVGENGDWSVVKLAVPSIETQKTGKASASTTQAAKDDPRSSLEQRFPPWSAGI